VWRDVALLLTASCFTFLLGLGRAAISDSDEAFYAEAAREMVESGNWLTPHYNYEERFQKPILYYWLAASVFLITGPSEASARLPAALCGVVLVLVTWGCGRRWADRRTGFLAGLITASNFGYFALARQALPDLPLATLMTIATWTGLEAAERFSAAERNTRGRGPVILLLTSAVAAGLAFLMKGPVGVALPVLIIVVSARLGLVGPRRWLPAPAGALVAAAAAFAGIAAPWFVEMANRHGIDYLYRFFVTENVERFATDRYNEPRSPFFYVPIVFGGLAPWSAFLLLWIPGLVAAARSRRLTLTARQRLLVLWAAIPFVFYSLSIGKQPRYILPILPPLAILLAGSMLDRARREASRARTSPLMAWLATMTTVSIVTLGVLLYRAAPLLAALSPSATHMAAILIVAGGIVLAGVAWLRQRALYAVLAVVAIATFLAMQYSVFSARGSEPVQRMAAAHIRARQGHEPSGTHRVFVRNLIFYTQVPQTDLTDLEELADFLRRRERVLCVVRESDLERVARDHGIRAHVVGSIRYFNTAGFRLKTLLWPNPAADLETVHLVTNRRRDPSHSALR
jgi:4-amino-4-deoxy-L-arabinose transferase-like glycosyltransferase